MITYNPQSFASLFATHNGDALLDYLQGPAEIVALETASCLGRPAIMAVRTGLLERFPEHMKGYRFHQMAGHMIHQILADRGWEIDDPRVQVRAVPFITATSYRRPGRETFHVYRNRRAPQDICICRKRSTANLPKGDNWLYHTRFWTPLEAEIGFDIDDFKAMAAEVESAGFVRMMTDRVDVWEQ